jgi:glutamyl-tRNA reductase
VQSRQRQVEELKGQIGEVLTPEIDRLKEEAEAAAREREQREKQVEEIIKELEEKRVLEK